MFMFLLISVSAFAQASMSDKKSIVYDPSFWRDELHLNNAQYRRMQEIAKEFYERLVGAFNTMKDDRKAFLQVFEQCCITRSTLLWETMNARQQKKWKKIAESERMTEVLPLSFSE